MPATDPVEADTWREGRDGTTTVYSERLLPPWWLWFAAGAFAAMVAVAYGYAWGAPAAVLSALVVAGGLGALLVATSSVVAVDDRVVRAGRAGSRCDGWETSRHWTAMRPHWPGPGTSTRRRTRSCGPGRRGVPSGCASPIRTTPTPVG